MSTTPVRGLENWVWMYKGEEYYTNSRGVKSKARHATNIKTGHRISVRQVQKMQHIALKKKNSEIRSELTHRKQK